MIKRCVLCLFIIFHRSSLVLNTFLIYAACFWNLFIIFLLLLLFTIKFQHKFTFIKNSCDLIFQLIPLYFIFFSFLNITINLLFLKRFIWTSWLWSYLNISSILISFNYLLIISIILLSKMSDICSIRTPFVIVVIFIDISRILMNIDWRLSSPKITIISTSFSILYLLFLRVKITLMIQKIRIWSLI
jgi:hypothetical protein